MPTPPTRRLQHAVIAGVVLFCVAILVLAYVSYQQYEADYGSQTEARLLAIAEMKAAEVSAWRRERVADGQFYADNQAVIALWRRVLDTPAETAAAEALRDLLGRMQRNHLYDRISIHDATGVERIAAPVQSADDGHMTDEVVAVGRDGRSRFLDLHQDGTGVPHMAIIVPLQSTPTADAPSLAGC
ncbi:MAG: hypothetical protein IT185_05920 [Acidobacteria bacterium]|nr:hypothetical protein [Acidobacteriota bacterium]